ncbi:MAG: hypothetical protein ACRC8A_13310 [Microcoleaceae cyanobacterium]
MSGLTKASIKASLDAYRKKVATEFGATKNAPGGVMMTALVDSNTKVNLYVPGRIIMHFNIADSAIADNVGYYKPKILAASTVKNRGLPAGAAKEDKSMIGEIIKIPLSTPYTKSVKGKNRLISNTTMRFNALMNLKCIAWWLYNHCGTKPGQGWTYRGFFFPVSNIPTAQLGDIFQNKPTTP